MNTVIVLRLVIIGIGILFLSLDFINYARRKLTETIGLGWGLVSICLILTGAIPGLSGWCWLISGETAVVLVVFVLFLLFGGFYLSISVSKLIINNQELAMQVSLLNQENERILNELQKSTGRSKEKI